MREAAGRRRKVVHSMGMPIEICMMPEPPKRESGILGQTRIVQPFADFFGGDVPAVWVMRIDEDVAFFRNDNRRQDEHCRSAGIQPLRTEFDAHAPGRLGVPTHWQAAFCLYLCASPGSVGDCHLDQIPIKGQTASVQVDDRFQARERPRLRRIDNGNASSVPTTPCRLRAGS